MVVIAKRRRVARRNDTTTKCFGPVTGAQLSGRQRHAPIFHRALARAVRTCSLEANARSSRQPQLGHTELCNAHSGSYPRYGGRHRAFHGGATRAGAHWVVGATNPVRRPHGSCCHARHCHHPRLWPVQRRLQVRVAKAPPPPERAPGGGSPVRLHPTALLPSIIESVSGTVAEVHSRTARVTAVRVLPTKPKQRQGPAQSD